MLLDGNGHLKIVNFATSWRSERSKDGETYSQKLENRKTLSDGISNDIQNVAICFYQLFFIANKSEIKGVEQINQHIQHLEKSERISDDALDLLKFMLNTKPTAK